MTVFVSHEETVEDDNSDDNEENVRRAGGGGGGFIRTHQGFISLTGGTRVRIRHLARKSPPPFCRRHRQLPSSLPPLRTACSAANVYGMMMYVCRAC